MRTLLAIVASILLATTAHAQSSPRANDVLLTGGVAYQWAEDDGVEASWWSVMAAVDWFMPGPYVGFGVGHGPRVAFEYEDEDLGNDSRVLGLNASLGYTFGNWTPFVKVTRSEVKLDLDVRGQRVVSDDDWSDPEYAIGTWYRGNESTRFHASVGGLARDDSEAGLFTGFRAMPTSTRFVFWGDIGYAPSVKGIFFGLGIGVHLGGPRRSGY